MLRIEYADYEALRAHGEETYPNECCGVLLGKNIAKERDIAAAMNHVQKIVRAGNTRTDSAHNRYNIAPQELVKIQRQARGLGLDIVGFYHSHPDHPAQWSTDRLRRSTLAGLLLHHHQRRTGQSCNDELLSADAEQTEDNKKFEDEAIQIDIAQSVADVVA